MGWGYKRLEGGLCADLVHRLLDLGVGVGDVAGAALVAGVREGRPWLEETLCEPLAG